MMLRSVIAGLVVLGALVVADGAKAATFKSYSFTQDGFVDTNPGSTVTGTVSGSFAGEVNSLGTIERSDLTAFNVTFELLFSGGHYFWQGTSPMLFSFNTTGGPTTLDFVVPLIGPLTDQTLCVGAAAALGVRDCGPQGGEGNFASLTTAQFPQVQLLSTTVTPIPATLPLFGTALVVLAGFGRRRAARKVG